MWHRIHHPPMKANLMPILNEILGFKLSVALVLEFEKFVMLCQKFTYIRRGPHAFKEQVRAEFSSLFLSL